MVRALIFGENSGYSTGIWKWVYWRSKYQYYTPLHSLWDRVNLSCVRSLFVQYTINDESI
jgi:hypothetical protein